MSLIFVLDDDFTAEVESYHSDAGFTSALHAVLTEVADAEESPANFEYLMSLAAKITLRENQWVAFEKYVVSQLETTLTQ